jgi:DNA helicase INO80
MENLMNLVMQFRKVCNHPDLFERRMGKSPFLFSVMQTGMCQNMSLVTAPTIYVANKNPINVIIPKLIYDECFLISDDNTRLFTKYNKGMDVSLSTVSVDTHFKLFNIFSEQNIHD